MFDQGILDLVNKLCENGFEAYLVGGVVRDHLLGKVCHDYDVTTNATPEQIKKIYKDYQIFSYGEKFGTIGINYLDYVIEITTFRKEDEYADNRHPRIIKFDANLESDVKRRDFTINAIAYDVKKKEIVDLEGGIKDLEDGVIKAVGDPNQRFLEDALRIIRAIRFSARFNFKIDEKTKEAIHKNYMLLANVSKERITEEMSKILINGFENVVYEYYDVFNFLIPELKGINIGLLKLKSDNLVFKLAIVFTDVTDLNKAINNFRFPKVTILRVKSIIHNNDLVLSDDLINTRILLHKLGEEYYLDLNNYHKLIGLSYTSDIILNEALKLGYQNSCLAVNGRNVKASTGFSGKEISDCIEEVFSEVVKGNLENEKYAIKTYLFNKYGKANFLKKKIALLKLLCAIFDKHQAAFSLGAGAMLYFRGVETYFNDLDISVSKDDYLKIKDDLDKITTHHELKWDYIYHLTINDEDVDLVVKDENVLDKCDYVYNLDGYIINLESLDYWLGRYQEMGRDKRVNQILMYKGGK